LAEKACAIFRVLPFSFGILCTAMFAEPTIPEIEKVVGLLHEGPLAANGSSGVRCRFDSVIPGT